MTIDIFNPTDSNNGYIYVTDNDCSGNPSGLPPVYLDEVAPGQSRFRISYDDPDPGVIAFFKRRGYIFFTPSIPGGNTVTKVELLISTPPGISHGTDTYFLSQALQKVDYPTDKLLFEGIATGSVYTSGSYSNSNPDNPLENVIDLGSQAVIDLNADPTKFAVGMRIDETLNPGAINEFYTTGAVSAWPDNIPKLRVTYATAATNTNFLIMF